MFRAEYCSCGNLQIFRYDVFEQSVGENVKSETEKLHSCKWNTMEHLQGGVEQGYVSAGALWEKYSGKGRVDGDQQ